MNSKIALISDIHANLPALEAIINALDVYKPDKWICLGDIVGYGPHPEECIDIVRSMNMQCVMGNHDAGVVKKLTEKHFRNPNRQLIIKTREMISKSNFEWLSSLPLMLETDTWQAVHASPIEPEKWNYLESAFTIRNILKKQETGFCFFGHTHKPVLVSDTIGVNTLKEGHKYLINPGSVGQSRDGDFRASASILDLESLDYENIRVPFKLEKVVMDIEQLGFSRKEAEHMMRV